MHFTIVVSGRTEDPDELQKVFARLKEIPSLTCTLRSSETAPRPASPCIEMESEVEWADDKGKKHEGVVKGFTTKDGIPHARVLREGRERARLVPVAILHSTS